MKKKILQINLALLATMGMSGLNAQIGGDLDATFGVSGYVLTDHVPNTGEVFLDMITLSNDKIVMVGYTTDANQNILVARFNADGTPDVTFGSNGSTSIDASIGLNEQAWAVKELSDGKLLITGIIVTGGSWDGFIMRLDTVGTIDTSFGTTVPGRTNFNAGDNTIALGTAIEVLSDNSILVGGSALFGGTADMVVFKFTQGGGSAVAFASGGYANFDIDGENDEVFAMALTPNEQIVLAGYSDSVGVRRGAVVMLSSFGTPTSFGGFGYFTFDLGSGNNELKDVVIDANDKIVAVGFEGSAPDINGVVLRLNTDGSLDNTFSSDGFQNSDPGVTTSMYLENVFIMANGGILTTGYMIGSVSKDLYAFLMDSSGSPDSNFGGNGDAIHTLPVVTNTMSGICGAVQSDGGILIGGDITGQDFTGNNMFMIRLLPVDYTGIDELGADKSSLTVYPNPATEFFVVKMDNTDEFSKIELVSMQGEVVQTWMNEQTHYEVASILEGGNYLVKLYTDKTVYVSRLAVIK